MRKSIIATLLVIGFLTISCTAPKIRLFPSQADPLQEFTLEGEAQQKDSRITLANGDASRALVHSLFPEDLQVTEKEGLKDHDPDTKVTYLALSPREARRDAKFMTAVIPLDPGGNAPPPVLEKLRGHGMYGVRIREGGAVTDVYLNLRADGSVMHQNSCAVIHGWETDAYLFAVTRPENADADDVDAAARYFIACGSYLRRGGAVVLGSLSKVYSVFSYGKPVMEAALKGQPHLTVTIRAPEEPRGIRLNAVRVPVTYDGGRKRVTLSLLPQ